MTICTALVLDLPCTPSKIAIDRTIIMSNASITSCIASPGTLSSRTYNRASNTRPFAITPPLTSATTDLTNHLLGMNYSSNITSEPDVDIPFDIHQVGNTTSKCTLPVSSYTSISMTSNPEVAASMSDSGEAMLGTFVLSDTERLCATKYSAEVYSARFLDSHTDSSLRPHKTYHSGDLSTRGTREDRARFLRDVRLNSLQLSQDHQRAIINEFGRGAAAPTSLVSEKMRSVAMGLRYARDDVHADDETKALYYARGLQYAAAHSKLGIISGRSILTDPSAVSTPLLPIIDSCVKANFGQTGLPKEEFDTHQQGVLVLQQQQAPSIDQQAAGSSTTPTDQIKSNPFWTIPYNDSFYLGAIHYHRPVYLASTRSSDNMRKPDDSGALRIFGREVALCWASHSVELHQAGHGEVFVPIGASTDHGAEGFNVSAMMKGVARYVEDDRYKASLSWLHDVCAQDGGTALSTSRNGRMRCSRNGGSGVSGKQSARLEPGEVIVQSLQKLVDGEWKDMRDLNKMDSNF